MALINCPECNKEISDKSEICINCGYKLPKPEPKFQGVYCPKCLYSILKTNIEQCPHCHTKFIDSIHGTIHECCNYTKNHPELKQSPEFSQEEYDKRINYVPGNYITTNLPKCPTCQSTNIRKMSGVESGASILTFGIFSKKINKTFKCNKCGYTW